MRSFGVVGVQEVLVEVRDRVFLAVVGTEIAQHRVHVGSTQQVDDLVDAQFVEIEVMAALSPAVLAARQHERFHQLLEERIRDRNQVRQRLGLDRIRVRDARRQQPVGDRLRIHVGELILGQIVDQRRLEPRHQGPQRPVLGFELEQLVGALPDAARQCRELIGEVLRGRDDLTVLELERSRPALTPRRQRLGTVRPGQVRSRTVVYPDRDAAAYLGRPSRAP